MIQKDDKEETKRINKMKTNSKRKRELRLKALGMLRSLYKTVGLRMTINEFRKNKIVLSVIQKMGRTKTIPQTFTISQTSKHKFGTAFFVDRKYLVTNSTSISERLCEYYDKR
jgi:hypothetical protein